MQESISNRLNALLAAASNRQELVLFAFMITAIAMMIVPLPTTLVDALIALNLMLSIMILMVAIYLHSPLEFSVFPGLLLITTLYRLALTIATSRLILLKADAGHIVYTFGHFVVGGNIAVGIIIFTILTVVQFIVITKGAERVAEVSARFSLDGMPGRQMSIDSDVRAGVLTPEGAKLARDMLQKENRLYGAMDGAMKFVKGDAIASIIVVLINLVGGIAIGVMQHDMSASTAVATYSVLSVGDGLIAQIPALFISIAAGLVVTRVPDEAQQNLAAQMVQQLTAQPKTLAMAGAVLLLFALIPGFPTLIFVLLAACAFGLWYYRKTHQQAAADRQSKAAAVSDANAATPAALRICLGPDTADTSRLQEALERFCRDQFDTLGLPLPLPVIEAVPELPRRAIEIRLYATPVVSLMVPENAGLAWVRARAVADGANEYRLPWGAVLSWLVGTVQVPEGVIVYTGEQCIVALLDAVIARYAEDFMGLQETRALVDSMEKIYPELVRELQRSMPLPRVSEVMRRLVAEGVSVRNLRAVFEALINWSSKEKNIVLLTEYVRNALRRQICYALGGASRRIVALMIGQRIENMVRESIRETAAGSYSALEADKTNAILGLIRHHIEALEATAQRPVLLTAMDVRRYVRKMIEREFFATPVLSNQELIEDVELQVVANIELIDEPKPESAEFKPGPKEPEPAATAS